MESKAKLLGHPVHPMLIVFPLGLLATAVAFDVVALIQSDPSWYHISYWLIASGIIGGLLAAVFGLVGLFSISRQTTGKRVGVFHGGGNVLVVLVFICSWVFRRGAPGVPHTTALAP